MCCTKSTNWNDFNCGRANKAANKNFSTTTEKCGWKKERNSAKHIRKSYQLSQLNSNQRREEKKEVEKRLHVACGINLNVSFSHLLTVAVLLFNTYLFIYLFRLFMSYYISNVTYLGYCCSTESQRVSAGVCLPFFSLFISVVAVQILFWTECDPLSKAS